MAVRLQDIASDLNLSKMTISKVLRGQTDVSAATKARVLQRARELNYRPNVSARSLRTGHTQSAGLVVSSLANPALARMTAGLNEVLRAAGYGLVIASADHETGTSAETAAREVELQLGRQTDVLFLLLDEMTAKSLIAGQEERTQDKPTTAHIYLGPFADAGEVPENVFMVGVREEAIGRAAARHLMHSGCERIAVLRGGRTPAYDERLSGFLRAARAGGLAPRAEWVVQGEPGASEYQSGLALGRRLFAGSTVPDGVAACTDLQACGLRDAAFEVGLRIPEQVQVLGVGNRAELCEVGWLGAGLSSVDIAAEETGQQAARLGLAQLSKDATPRAGGSISPRIVQRGSTLGGRDAGRAKEKDSDTAKLRVGER